MLGLAGIGLLGDMDLAHRVETRSQDLLLTLAVATPHRLDNVIKARFLFLILLILAILFVIGAFVPSIGHAGICTSEGVIYDFAGPYYVSVDDMAFGNPTKYIYLDLRKTLLKNNIIVN